LAADSSIGPIQLFPLAQNNEYLCVIECIEGVYEDSGTTLLFLKMNPDLDLGKVTPRSPLGRLVSFKVCPKVLDTV
jgi:hypothetical protein